MTIPVQLVCKLGSLQITKDVSGLAFRKEAVGGLQNMTFNLKRPLDRLDSSLSPYTPAYIHDARSADCIAEGRIADTGRTASTQDGQQWSVTCFGPAQHASDRVKPYIVIDQQLDRWNFDEYASDEHSAVVHFEKDAADAHGTKHGPHLGQTVPSSFNADAAYRAIYDAGQSLGGVKCNWISGITDSDYKAQIRTKATPTAGGSVRATNNWNTAGGAASALVTTDFPTTETIAVLRAARVNTTIISARGHWLKWYGISVQAMLKDATGADRTTGSVYSTAYFSAHEVVNDLLGRFLDQFDGAGSSVSTAGTYHIDQMAYPDGVTAAQVLDDAMLLEPSMRWYAGPSNSTGKYPLTWEAWPTTVRYEATLDDGGDFPITGMDLYNEVTVRWVDPHGRPRTITRTGACPTLDSKGVTRTALLDLGDEISSAAGAVRVGDNFLADHKYPNNAGTLNVARKIWDAELMRMVDPWEIEPGELIRVRGIESYPDALNASSKDGQTVFRIWAMNYTSDSNTATLELDTYPRRTAHALARLMKRRNRKR